MEAFLRPTLKRHRPVTRRQNTGEEYRGCLMVEVPRSGRLYWWIEGAVTGIAGAAVPEQDGKV